MSVSHEYLTEELGSSSWIRRLNALDWGWALLLAASAAYVLTRYHGELDKYQTAITIGAAGGLTLLGWTWRRVRILCLAVAAVSLIAVYLYGNSLSNAQHSFWLEYLLQSQSMIMWMSALFVLATLSYFAHLFTGSEFLGKVGSGLTWCGAATGLIGLMVRWRESYLISPAVGHIPISNLYEVFILFCIVTSLLYLHYEQKLNSRSIGGFVMMIVSAAVAFLLWYTFDRHAQGIEPLVPALKSYWMKMHVPANFIGYGCFSMSAMVGVGYLFGQRRLRTNPNGLLAQRMPPLEQLDDLMYKTIALGFGFFTIATILGALWAAQAWGGYWSWDPKETWALIVWLNYAAWLHMRITKGWRGAPMAWWSIVGLVVTSFAFLGVNMFLSGLHSYGHL